MRLITRGAERRERVCLRHAGIFFLLFRKRFIDEINSEINNGVLDKDLIQNGNII